MKNFILTATSAFFIFSGCSLLQAKVDPNQINSASGFDYKFPKTGEWIEAPSSNGQKIIGKKPESDGSTTLATARFGSIGVTTEEINAARKSGQTIIKAHTDAEIISSFKKNIEADAKNGHVKNIHTTYKEKKYEGGSCLIFSQTGEDEFENKPMLISNEGKWCFNPQTYSYIMMNLSARVPKGKSLPNLNNEKTEFFDSMIFTKK